MLRTFDEAYCSFHHQILIYEGIKAFQPDIPPKQSTGSPWPNPPLLSSSPPNHAPRQATRRILWSDLWGPFVKTPDKLSGPSGNGPLLSNFYRRYRKETDEQRRTGVTSECRRNNWIQSGSFWCHPFSLWFLLVLFGVIWCNPVSIGSFRYSFNFCYLEQTTGLVSKDPMVLRRWGSTPKHPKTLDLSTESIR